MDSFIKGYLTLFHNASNFSSSHYLNKPGTALNKAEALNNNLWHQIWIWSQVICGWQLGSGKYMRSLWQLLECSFLRPVCKSANVAGNIAQTISFIFYEKNEFFYCAILEQYCELHCLSKSLCKLGFRMDLKQNQKIIVLNELQKFMA
jgi:hypothetical protein